MDGSCAGFSGLLSTSDLGWNPNLGGSGLGSSAGFCCKSLIGSAGG